MPINQFNGDLFIEKLNMTQRDRDLIAINEAWPSLSLWQQKKIYWISRWFVFRRSIREKWQAWRAVIVPARRDLPTFGQLFAMSTDDERLEAVAVMLRVMQRRKRRAAWRAVIVPAWRVLVIFLLCAACFR